MPLVGMFQEGHRDAIGNLGRAFAAGLLGLGLVVFLARPVVGRPVRVDGDGLPGSIPLPVNPFSAVFAVEFGA